VSTIYIIDDDQDLCFTLNFHLKNKGHVVSYATNAEQGIESLKEHEPDLILLDLHLPDQDGLEVLGKIKSIVNDTPIVMITADQDMKATIEAMRTGAFDYLRKPFDIDDILLLIEKARHFKTRLKQPPAKSIEASPSPNPLDIIGSSPRMVEVVKRIGLLSRSNVTVLIEGESGTGKEIVARVLHETSASGRPFVPINCSSIVPTLLESELFGHEKGAFTGASSRKTGKLEYADNGTLFLDEIGDMPLDLQAKILRVLQEKSFERVGGLESIPFEARVIAATNKNLASLVQKQEFREDLYYRLAISRITMPPLRERREDIPMLVRHLCSRIATELHRKIEGVEEEAIKRMQKYDWPGNVRELENVVTRAIALAKGPVITSYDLEFSFDDEDSIPSTFELIPLKEVEKKYIEKALITTGWNITQTARSLEIAPNTLRKKIAEYNLRRPQ